MNKAVSKVIAVVTFLLLVSSAQAVLYSGSLSSQTGQIDGVGGWIDPGHTTIEWQVWDNPDFSWHYEYTLTVPQSDVSHFIIELSESATADHIFNLQGPFAGTEVKLHSGPSSGNPDMPGDLFGIKFDGVTGTTVSLSFDAWRMPVWGDFYAKCGATPPNQAWNMGFLNTDPPDPPSSGTIDNHILVPDTYIPEPVTLLLLALGTVALKKKR
jgi:hypothetical protein